MTTAYSQWLADSNKIIELLDAQGRQIDACANSHDAKLDAVSSQLQQLRAEQQRLGNGISAVLSSNATLAAQVRLLLQETHRLPTLFVVLPLTPDAGFLTRLKSGQVSKEKFVLYFLCSQSHIPVACRMTDGKGDFVFSLTREWAKKAAPVVALGLVCLKLALTAATGMPVPIPTAGVMGIDQGHVDAALQLFARHSSQRAVGTIYDTAVDGLQQQLDQVAAGDSAAKEALMARVRGMEGSRAAYEAVRMVVEQHGINVGSQCGLRQVICEDKVAWVLDEDSIEQAWRNVAAAGSRMGVAAAGSRVDTVASFGVDAAAGSGVDASGLSYATGVAQQPLGLSRLNSRMLNSLLLILPPGVLLYHRR